MEMISAHPIAFAFIGILLVLAIAAETRRILRERRNPNKHRYHAGGFVSNGTIPPDLLRTGERYIPSAFADRLQELAKAGDLIRPPASSSRELQMVVKAAMVHEITGRVPPPTERLFMEDHRGRRIPMRNRYMATDEDPVRSDLMADQIVRDQIMANEEPGKRVFVSEDTTFYTLRESINRFTFIIGKEGFMAISEATPDGAETPAYEVPKEWAEPMIVAVFEVARLRRGWTE